VDIFKSSIFTVFSSNQNQRMVEILVLVYSQSVMFNDYKLYGTQLNMSYTGKQESQATEDIGEKVQESGTQFTEIIKQLVDKLTGKDMEFTYDFQNLEIDVPRVPGPEGKELASAKWKINGRFVLSTALLNASSSESNGRLE